MSNLTSLLRSTFGHSTFRANQEAVCVAASAGKDVLLVMPTGAGKSLCYQLPALARGGTALVISPLIALMDDQAAKLSSHNLRVARIHSGLSRDDARQACRDYLDGTLDFLFIAPERMRVPGFPEMLARRKPTLIAIDEAHCISAWGHDFRPDYRTLGEHLPALRPAPIIALTATATPTVQQDIVAQLHLQTPSLFIHGFRRSNLAIEVVEMSKPRRHNFTASLLKDPAARPAIVYAPSRKAAEELAAELNAALRPDTKLGAPSIAPLSHAMGGSRATIAAAYHAGLEPSVRERTQAAFQSGRLEVVVATIAFGMGIDKADVRTVIHTALPASVEAFYQEIGRAGRDGLPARTVLLHSYADRKMHEFFFERDYPPADDLARVAAVLTDEDLMPEPLARRLKMDLNTFQKSIEKLVAQGAAAIDLAGNVRRSGNISQAGAWRKGYEAQLAFRRAQLDRMATYAETQQCRMTAVIRHFGDTADAHRPCGNCDFCSPHTTSAQTFAPPTTEQARHLRLILRALEARSTSTGKLHTELALGKHIDRSAFDVLLDALVRAGLVTLTSETFTSKDDDREITYKKAALTHEGRSDDANELTGVLLPADLDSTFAAAGKSSSRKRSRSSQESKGPKARSIPAQGKALGSAANTPQSAEGATYSRSRTPENSAAPLTPTQNHLDESLRRWRMSEAAKTGKPAFMVLSDAVIRNIAIAHPQSLTELLTISGIGPNKADQLGADIIALCRTTTTPANSTNEYDDAALKFHASANIPNAPQSTRTTKTAKRPKVRNIPAQAEGLGIRANKSPSAEGATHNSATAATTNPSTFTRPRAPPPPTPPNPSPPTNSSSTKNSAPGASPNQNASASRNFSSSAPPLSAPSCCNVPAPSPNSKPSPASAPTKPKNSGPPSSSSATHSLIKRGIPPKLLNYLLAALFRALVAEPRRQKDKPWQTPTRTETRTPASTPPPSASSSASPRCSRAASSWTS
jgi:ATP-dependent DNA helicase RecQ